MSLVGPRPCLMYEYELYQDWHKKRTRVRPGITGLWQVTGRSNVAFDDMILLDLYYVYNRSFLMDFNTLYETVFVVLQTERRLLKCWEAGMLGSCYYSWHAQYLVKIAIWYIHLPTTLRVDFSNHTWGNSSCLPFGSFPKNYLSCFHRIIATYPGPPPKVAGLDQNKTLSS